MQHGNDNGDPEPNDAEPDREPEPDGEPEPDSEPEPADVDPGALAAQRARRRLMTRIVVLAVAPSVILLPLLLSRSPAPPAMAPLQAPPTVTWTPPTPTPLSSPQVPALTSGRAVDLIQDADQSLQYQTSRAQLLALAALEDAVTPETLVEAGKVLTPAHPTARALHGGRAAVTAVAFSPDGTLVATGQGATVRLWNARGAQLVRTLTGTDGAVHGLAFSPDGRTLAVAGGNPAVRLWQVGSGRQVGALTDPSGAALHRVTFSPDGQRLATSGPSGVRIWTARDQRAVVTLTVTAPRSPVQADGGGEYPPSIPWVPPLAFSPDGRTLAVGIGDGSTTLYDPATGRSRTNLPTDTSTNAPGEDDPTTAVAFAPNGYSLACGHRRGAVDLWNPAAGTITARLADDPETATGYDPVSQLAYSPDGRRLAMSTVFSDNGTDGSDGRVTLVDLPVPDEYDLGHPLAGAAFGLALSPDGRQLVTADSDDIARLWQLDAGSAFRAPVRDWPAALCARAGSNLDARTWQQYFGDAAYRRLCADFPGPPDGNLDAPERPLPRLG